jgi:peptide-methionine (S)-S-oxide reductase
MTLPRAAKFSVLVAAAAILAVPLFGQGLHAQSGIEAVRRLPPPAAATPAAPAGMETAVLAGGCFWGIQGVFAHVKGVSKVVSGYSGGEAKTAHYGMVGTGRTGHAEAVRITFDPKQVSYGQVLQIFFSVGTDPTQLNRQFPDQGPQYRSNIFFSSPAQQATATAYIAQLNRSKAFGKPIVTRVDALQAFFPAERYHQDYLTLHPEQPYIATYDLPKVAALKSLFPDAYRATPVLAKS